ncbi:MAG: hypothetical protein CVU18_13450 [Betaproteobacteria bacterium HGW-Betaproteobacteria-12]|nr:MAG: hypothetical protein CVU18_13450 [Betaproteobacteria bacterium HGW-Betaproteobacteria-12]
MRGINNKRGGDDRRNLEKGPPNGWRERRRSVERRQPDVREIPFSEWLACLRGRVPEKSGQS